MAFSAASNIRGLSSFDSIFSSRPEFSFKITCPIVGLFLHLKSIRGLSQQIGIDRKLDIPHNSEKDSDSQTSLVEK